MFILFCCVASPALVYLGASTLADEKALQERGRVTFARVTEAKILSNKNPPEYQVRYTFTPDGVGWFSYSDRTTRRNLWASLPQEVWAQATSSSWLRVRYLPEDPWVNEPANSEGTPSRRDAIAGIVLGAMPWLIVIFIWAGPHR
jgi:hypothetical protein